MIISKTYSSTTSLKKVFGEQIKEYIIGDEVTSIGDYAFYGCFGLTSVTIGNSVTSIGDYAFYGCSGLTSVTIPNSVTSIGKCAFSGTNLRSLTIGPGVTSIGSSAFNRPTKTIWLTNTPPSGYIGASGAINYVANNQYSSLSNKKEYPFLSSIFEVDGVKYVPVSPSERTCDAIDCLYDESAENIHIKTTVSYKGVSLTVKSVNPYTFYGNNHIKDVQFGIDGDVGGYAFADCISLESCTLGDKVTAIGASSFSNCKQLKEIVIPDAVSSIGSSAFSGCHTLLSATIGLGVKTISEYAFSDCSSLPQIEIPSSVTSIADYTFSGCTNLSKVIIADRQSILSIGSNGSSPLFASCPLDSVYIGGDISYNATSSYGYSPFYRNTSLRAIHITGKETEISENEFYGCTNLKNVRIGDAVKTIGDRAFSGCSSLEYFAFGSEVQTIGQEAFSDCTAMTQLYSSAKTPPVCGSQALDDINKWNCTLHVPSGSVADYQAANQWKEFFFIDEMTTKINELTTDTHDINGIHEIFDLQGKKRDSMQPGLNIIRMNDGITKKIMVK